jgi:amino acid adenylation domain-containing protein
VTIDIAGMTGVPRAESDGLRWDTRPGRCVGPTNAFVPIEHDRIDRSVPEFFEESAARYPDRIAIKARNRSLTYHSLNHAANRVARAILAEQRGCVQPIALLLEKDAPLFVAALGALKAGQLYVPIDLAQPPSRIASILEDSQSGLIVSNERHRSLADGLSRAGRRFLNIDQIGADVPGGDLGLEIHPDTLAYVLYTSGSTGQPRGVVQTHRYILHTARNYVGSLHISRDDRMALVPSFSFSMSVKATYGPLLVGATLCPIEIRQEGLALLADWLIREGITLCQFSPSVFRHFIGSLTGHESFPKLRLIDLGGEPAYRSDLELYRKHFSPDCLLLNTLGGTEFGPLCEYFIDRQTEVTTEHLPVGHTVPDKEVRLLDEGGHDVGFGRVGEIVVKSRYLTPGYWRQPELTRAAFQLDPVGGGERVYRTGDLGLRLPDGCLVHLGRKDFQVKIRGQRVATAEVEMSLQALEGVAGAVVVGREDEPGETRLVAYVVPARTPPPTARHLRRGLSAKLPDFMVPSAFVMLEALPVLPSGKVHREALPAPDWTAVRRETDYVAPRDAMEYQLVALWEEIFGIESIGTEDDFFELGGHSLLAARLFARLEKAIGRRFSPAVLFRAPTIKRLATLLEAQGQPAEDPRLVPIQPLGSSPPFFSAFGMVDHGHGLRKLARHLGPDQPLYGINLWDPAPTDSPDSMIEELAASSLQAIRVIQPEGPYRLGGYSFGGLVAVEMARQLYAEGERIALLALIDTFGPNYPRPLSRVEREVRYFRSLRDLPRAARLGSIKSRIRLKDRIRGLQRVLQGLVQRRAGPEIESLPSRSPSREEIRLASRAYRIRLQPFPGRVTLFRATAPLLDRRVSCEDPYNGWGRVALGGVSVYAIPGEHRRMFHEPAISALGEHLSGLLRELRTKECGPSRENV